MTPGEFLWRQNRLIILTGSWTVSISDRWDFESRRCCLSHQNQAGLCLNLKQNTSTTYRKRNVQQVATGSDDEGRTTVLTGHSPAVVSGIDPLFRL